MTSIDSNLKENRLFPPSEQFKKNAHIGSSEEYERLYLRSIQEPELFWAEQAREHLTWFREWDQVLEYDPSRIGTSELPYLKYFSGGELNVSYNCLDRHVESWRRNKVAIFWQGEREEEKRVITYLELYQQVCRFANVLKERGVKKGSTVTIFMPLIPETIVAMHACTRIGAIHSVVFSAFSPDSLRSRINDCQSELVITSDVGFHGGKSIPLKANVDEAIQGCQTVKQVIVYNRGGTAPAMQSGRDLWWHDEIEMPWVTGSSAPERMESEDPMFILYTSGSTGKPKGVLHTTAGYLLYAHSTFKYIFDIKEEDLFWCTADVGWITGHSYVAYGPLSNGASILLFEGVPTYPTPDRFWKIIEQYRVTIFYTAPTAIRALMRLGDEWPNKHDLTSLRLLGSVGEPINPEAWIWYHKTIGKGRCPIVDTWWQTETGGIMITTLPGAHSTKPGSAGKPFFGVLPHVLSESGSTLGEGEGGALFISKPWPGMIRGVYGDKTGELIKQVYFSRGRDEYFTGDGCREDTDGYLWLLGRIDDVINVSAHRFATAEIESALVGHAAVAEAAVVGFPHQTKGQGIYCFVTLKADKTPSEELRRALISQVRKEIGPIATPDKIQFAHSLPKTRSGKIMRRILRKIAEGRPEEVGDISTLADPSVVESLISDGLVAVHQNSRILR